MLCQQRIAGGVHRECRGWLHTQLQQQRGCTDGWAHNKSQLPCLQDVPRAVSTTDEWVLRQKSFLEGCKVREGRGKLPRLQLLCLNNPDSNSSNHAMAGCLARCLPGWMLPLYKQLTICMLCCILYRSCCPTPQHAPPATPTSA